MNAQQILTQKYGDPNAPDFDAKYISLWSPVDDGHYWWSNVKVPVYEGNQVIHYDTAGPFRINNDFRPMVHAAFKALEAGNRSSEIITFDGCEVHRHVAGTNSASAHSWGAAIDFNAAKNGQVHKPENQITASDRQGAWSAAFIKCFTDLGITFGGNFHVTPDPMHFCMVDG